MASSLETEPARVNIVVGGHEIRGEDEAQARKVIRPDDSNEDTVSTLNYWVTLLETLVRLVPSIQEIRGIATGEELVSSLHLDGEEHHSAHASQSIPVNNRVTLDSLQDTPGKMANADIVIIIAADQTVQQARIQWQGEHHPPVCRADTYHGGSACFITGTALCTWCCAGLGTVTSEWLWPDCTSASTSIRAVCTLDRCESGNGGHDMTKEEIELFLKSEIAAALNQEPEDIDEEMNFLKIGVSSVQALKIINRARKHLQVDISPVALFEYKTIAEFAAYLNESLLQEGVAE